MAAPRGWKAQDDADLLHLAESGFEIESVAWALNRSPHTIRARLAELGFAAMTRVVAQAGEEVVVAAETTTSGVPPQVGSRRYLGF